MAKQQFAVSEESKIQIPLKNLIGLIIAIAVGIIAWTDLTNRLTSVEQSLRMEKRNIGDNTTWIKNWERSGELPVDKIQNFKITELEKQIELIKQKPDK
jgi:hypothetical protein